MTIKGATTRARATANTGGFRCAQDDGVKKSNGKDRSRFASEMTTKREELSAAVGYVALEAGEGGGVGLAGEEGLQGGGEDGVLGVVAGGDLGEEGEG